MGYQETFSFSQSILLSHRNCILKENTIFDLEHWHCTQRGSQRPAFIQITSTRDGQHRNSDYSCNYSGSLDLGKASKGSLLVTHIIFRRTASTLSVERRNF